MSFVPTGFLPCFDLEVVHVDTSAIRRWTLHQLRALGIDCPLEDLHTALRGNEVPEIVQKLTARSLDGELREHTRAILRRAWPSLPWAQVVMQSVLQYRLVLPHDEQHIAPLHTDCGVGHQHAERNVWIPLTAARGSAAIHALSLRESFPFERARGDERYLQVDAPVRAIDMDVDELLLFTPHHVHGARVNRSHSTRVSVDLRILPAGEADAGYRWVPV